MTDSVTIRPVTADDRDDWRKLWEAYLDFYETSLPPSRIDRLWTRILDPRHPFQALVADVGGAVVGLVHYFPHLNTWEDGQVCYLQDLYVDRARRGHGIGEKLITAVRQHAREEGWVSIYWHTAEDNTTARGLYDKLTGGVSGFVVYESDV